MTIRKVLSAMTIKDVLTEALKTSYSNCNHADPHINCPHCVAKRAENKIRAVIASEIADHCTKNFHEYSDFTGDYEVCPDCLAIIKEIEWNDNV